MGAIGYGYGSECLLLRYLGRHRAALDSAIMTAVGASEIRWLDFPFDSGTVWGDGELKNLDFLDEDHPVRKTWAEVWPATGNPPNWDAVGRVRCDGAWEWLLVEAKANIGELSTATGAKAAGGLRRIEETLARTKAALDVDPASDWLRGYYQFANRLTVLHVLTEGSEPARLLFIYFTGDCHPTADCPKDQTGWAEALAAQDRHLGLRPTHPLATRVHKLFLPASGPRVLKAHAA
jgi:hypothetical protein